MVVVQRHVPCELNDMGFQCSRKGRPAPSQQKTDPAATNQQKLLVHSKAAVSSTKSTVCHRQIIIMYFLNSHCELQKACRQRQPIFSQHMIKCVGPVQPISDRRSMQGCFFQHHNRPFPQDFLLSVLSLDSLRAPFCNENKTWILLEAVGTKSGYKCGDYAPVSPIVYVVSHSNGYKPDAE